MPAFLWGSVLTEAMLILTEEVCSLHQTDQLGGNRWGHLFVVGYTETYFAQLENQCIPPMKSESGRKSSRSWFNLLFA
jgi:hypothetical protein